MGKSNSRISQTPWVCAVPKVMQNITAEPFDLFEVKINYPLQYPDIITRVGESSGLADHKSKPEELSQTHRFTADSAEVDYIKKNGEYLNDFDSDEEITEEERLHFPVWRGPDYEENDIKNYLISNMIFNQEECESLDQTQFIPENSKIYIKVYKTERNREDETDITVEADGIEEKVKGKSVGEYFKTEAFYIVKIKDAEDYEDIYVGEDGEKYIDINDIRFRVISTEKKFERLEYIKVKYDGKILKEGMTNPAYCIFLLYNSDAYFKDLPIQFALGCFFAACKKINELGYSIISDISPTEKEVREFFDKTDKVDIFYYSGHGEVENNIPRLKIFKDSNSVVSHETTNRIDLGFDLTPAILNSIGAKATFVYLNACVVGKYLSSDIENNFRGLEYEGAFGWKESPFITPTAAFDILFLAS